MGADAGACGCGAFVAAAPLIAWRSTGADLPGLIPDVLRIEGLSACGLKAIEDGGGRDSGG